MELNQIIEHVGVEPYYQEDAGVIYNADCLDILPKMPEKCVDLVLTDPPYGVRKVEDWDDYKLFEQNIEYWIDGCRQISKRLIWFCAGKMIPLIVGCRPREDFFRFLVWRKPPGSQYNGASHNNIWYSSEPILLFGDSKDWNEKGKDSQMGYQVFDAPTIAQKTFGHPTTKPLKLMEWLIDHHSDKEDIICDAFIGSGSTLVAAKQLGRKYIGIEIEEKYCKIAVQRLAQGILI